jgi:hypothetical protein
MQTLAGSLIGLPEDTVAVIGDDGKLQKTFRVMGRYYYTKKCKKPVDEGGVSLCHKSRMFHPCVMIMARGADCGKPAKPTKLEKEMGMTKGVAHKLKPTTVVFTPDDHILIKPSPYGTGQVVERFVHEDIIKGVIKDAE